MKRVICLLLSISLLLCGCAPARTVAMSYLRAGGVPHLPHGQTAFSDMILNYPDPDKVLSRLDQALQEVSSSGDPKQYIALYEAQLDAYSQLVSATSLAYVRYCQDITDTGRAQEYGRLNGALYAIQNRLAKLEKVLMSTWGYHQERGAAYAESLDRLSRLDSAAIRALRDREDELCRQYEQLDLDYRLTYKGRTWTMEELKADDSLSLSAFLEALELFQQGKNEAAGALYLELMSVRKQIVRASDSLSYAASQYAAFGRDYTPEQAASAAQVVKRVFVPLYIRLRERCENDLRYLSGGSFPEDQFVVAMEQAAERTVPGAGEAWRYMLTYGLYDSRPDPKKLQGSFTTYLAAYGCPFLFTQWKDDASSVFTVIHEFGHFLSYYTNPEGTYYGSENLDLAETDAQGLELLMLQEYGSLFGRYGSAARLCCLTNALYAILSGFMEDEFQQRAYDLENLTVESLNGLYGELAKEYGFDRLFGYEGREWTEIGHTFQFPFYYVSYGVSMLGAMALCREGSDAYERVLNRTAGTTFRQAIGIDVLAEDAILDLAAWVATLADDWLEE